MYLGGFMKRKRNKREKILQSELEMVAISMASFLKRYLGIYDEEILKMHPTHKELAILFPNLKRSSFTYVLSSPELVYLGQIILVDDGNGNIVPYIYDEQLKELSSYRAISQEQESNNNESETWSSDKGIEPLDIAYYNLDEMSIYELENLAKYYSRTGQERNYRRVIRAIVSRDDSIQAQSEYKVLKKEKKNNNDEF